MNSIDPDIFYPLDADDIPPTRTHRTWRERWERFVSHDGAITAVEYDRPR